MDKITLRLQLSFILVSYLIFAAVAYSAVLIVNLQSIITLQLFYSVYNLFQYAEISNFIQYNQMHKLLYFGLRINVHT